MLDSGDGELPWRQLIIYSSYYYNDDDDVLPIHVDTCGRDRSRFFIDC